MRFGQGLAFVFGESWAFARKAWWLAVLPGLPFLVYTLSYQSIDEAWVWPVYWSALGLTAILQAAMGYWVMRFIALGHDFAAAVSVNRDSARTFAPYFAVMSLLNLTILAGASSLEFLGDERILAFVWVIVVAVIALLVFPLLSLWSVTAPSGSHVIGPIRSARLVLPRLPWALGFIIVALSPVALLQFAFDRTVLSLPDLTIAGQSLRFLISTAGVTLFNAYSDLLFTQSLFVIAHRAGLRVDEDSGLASVFE